MNTFMTPKETAKELRSSERSLERHRANGTGPAFVKFGRRVLYRVSDVQAWAKANTFRNTSAVTTSDR